MNVIPKPLHYVVKEHAIKFGKATKISGDFPSAAAFAKKFLSNIDGGEGTFIKFSADEHVPAEGYVIISDKSGNGVTVSASGEAGAYYALMTLEQLIGNGNAVHCSDIQDKPQYAHRGFMLDCARHFWTVDKIKEIIEIMSHLKMNVFHWHLTEDQGWRAEIKNILCLRKKARSERILL